MVNRASQYTILQILSVTIFENTSLNKVLLTNDVSTFEPDLPKHLTSFD